MTSVGTPIRLGVVGCARILPAHLRGIALMQEVGLDPFRITALCARRLDDALMFRRRGKGPAPRRPASTNEQDPLGAPHLYVSDLYPDAESEVFDDWRAMLAADVVDAVLILAPVSLHHEIALAALKAGKHVLIEKPLAISVRAGRAITAEAARRGLVAGVAENVRYATQTRALGWALEQDAVGTPQLWLSGSVGGEWAPDRVVAHTPWRHRKLQAGGGPAVDLGVHLMHQIRYLMGPVEHVSALTRVLEPTRVDRDAEGRLVTVVNEVEDVFLAQLSFASGAIGSIFASWAGRGERTGLDVSPTIYGSQGCVKGPEIIHADGSRVLAVDLLTGHDSAELQARYFPGGLRDSFGLELLDFGTAIAGNSQMEASATEGVIDLAMAYAVLESALVAHPVRVADVLDGSVDAYQSEINSYYRLDAEPAGAGDPVSPSGNPS